MYNYGKTKKYEDCGCCKKMSYPNWKNDDQLDDIKDLLKKILHEKKDDKKDDRKDDKKDKCHDENCDVASITFNLTTQAVIFPAAGASIFGCTVTAGMLINELLQCLYNRGFRIVAFVASPAGTATAVVPTGVYTLVRCR